MRLQLLKIMSLVLMLLVGTPKALAGGTCPARTYNPGTDQANAKEWFKKGLRYWKLRASYDALNAWLCSFKLLPHRFVAFNIGRAAEARKKLLVALRYYRIFLRMTKKKKERKAAQLRIKVIEEKLTLIESKDGTVKWPKYQPPTGTTAAVRDCPRRTADPAVDKKNAGYWYGVALKHYKAREYIAAMSAWLCSYRIISHPLAAFNAAKAAERAKKYHTAKRYYREYLLLNPKASDRESVIGRIKAIREILARLKRKAPVIREPVYGGTKRGGAVGSPAARKRPLGAQRILGWVGVVTGAGLVAVGAVFGGLALRAKNQVESATDGEPWHPTLSYSYEKFPTYKKVAWVGLGLGAAVLTTGILLLVLKKRERPQVSVSTGPTVGGGFVSLSGSF